MAKQTSRGGIARSTGRGRSQATAKGRPWKQIALAAGAIAVVVLGFWFMTTRGSSTPATPAQLQLATANAAGAEVKVLTGSHHTVYHSMAPLPTSASPRADGRPTLVWFSGTWCESCEQMEPYAHATASKFTDRMVFAEKSVDDDKAAASRYAVRGTPTFVLIDANGKEIGRFGFQTSEAAFAAAIEGALKRGV